LAFAENPLIPRIWRSAGEYAENEVRKDFTPSERVAIPETIERKVRGGNQAHSQHVANADKAVKSAGFGNRETARQATVVARKGAPELVEAMDKGDIGIASATGRAVASAGAPARLFGCGRPGGKVGASARVVPPAPGAA
jgi:ParB family chromosome partitioning protein